MRVSNLHLQFAKEKKKIILGNKKTFCGLFDSLDYDVLFEDEIWKTVVELKNSLKDVQRNTKSNSSLRSDDVFYWYPLWCETALYFAESVNVEKNIWRRYLQMCIRDSPEAFRSLIPASK